MPPIQRFLVCGHPLDNRYRHSQAEEFWCFTCECWQDVVPSAWCVHCYGDDRYGDLIGWPDGTFHAACRIAADRESAAADYALEQFEAGAA